MQARPGNVLSTLGHTQSQRMLSLALWGSKHLEATEEEKVPVGQGGGPISHPTSNLGSAE